MRYIDPPVTEKTLDDYFGNIKEAIDTNRSTLSVFQDGIGGSTAWITYLRDHPTVLEQFFPRKNYQSIFINCLSCVEMSNLGFFYNLYNQINPKNKMDFLDVSVNLLLKQIKKSISKITKSKKLVIFITKYAEINESIKNEINRNLYDLWSFDSKKISLVISMPIDLQKVSLESLIDDFSYLKDVINQNIITIQNHKPEDIEHGLKQLIKDQNLDISDKDFKALIKLFDTSLDKLKQLVNHYSQSKNIKDVIQHSKLIGSSIKAPRKVEMIIKNGKFLCGGDDVSYISTINQKRVLDIFIKNKKQIVTRDQVAEAIWGHDFYEKYSDWAIDRHISDIRQKLASLKCSNKIKAIRGQGYLFTD